MCRQIVSGEVDAMQGEIVIAATLLRPWMTKQHRACLTEIGDLSEQHARQPFLIGANMAFSRRVLEKVPRFDVALGPGASGYMDDTLFYLQLQAAGYKFGFARGVSVEHHFDPSRLTRKAQLHSALAHGRSAAWVMHHWSHGSVRWRRVRMLLNAVRLAYGAVDWRLGAKVGFNPTEVDYAVRYYTYCELGRLAGSPRHYEYCGLQAR